MAGLALASAAGFGGGIEAYWRAVLAVLEGGGMDVVVVPLLEPARSRLTLAAKWRFVLRALSHAEWLRSHRDACILVLHPSVASVGALLWFLAGRRRVALRIICYGTDAWTLGPLARWWIRRWGAGLVAISNFTAGSLVDVGNARLLPPGLEPEWYEMLWARRRASQSAPGRMRILSVFRLNDAERKGVRTLLSALDHARREKDCLELTLAGHGPAPQWLREAVSARGGWASLVENPDRHRLADLYHAARLFVLPTRTSPPDGTGEGFGIVLAEAQLAGVPVVGPAFGGSADAMVTGVTGMRPADESWQALGEVIEWCLDHPAELAVMANNARQWASESFAPERYVQQVKIALFGAGRSGRLGLRITSDDVADGYRCATGEAHGASLADEWISALHMGGDTSGPNEDPSGPSVFQPLKRTWRSVGDADPD